MSWRRRSPLVVLVVGLACLGGSGVASGRSMDDVMPPAAGQPVVQTSADANARRVLFVRGADRSGGFLEAGSDLEARTEHLADIDNFGTSRGNHGWGEFAEALSDAGFTVTQVEERAEGTGITDGEPVDFTSRDLGGYDLLVFGSNNAVYTAAQVDAVDDYIRDGGAALFISDANFGGSWQDAPNSDQQFLDRYGIEVHQDQGTYVIDADDFVDPDHPVLAGVSAFDGEGVSPFDVGGADDDVDLTVLASAEGSVRTNPGDGKGPTRSAVSHDAAAWVATVGSGRLAGHFDRNTFFNDNGAGTDIGRFDNERYARQLMTWLTEGSTAPPPTVPPTVPSTVPPTTPPDGASTIMCPVVAAMNATRCDSGDC